MPEAFSCSYVFLRAIFLNEYHVSANALSCIVASWVIEINRQGPAREVSAFDADIQGHEPKELMCTYASNVNLR
jgi:hypothetical protein